jgi:TatD DNase family protein
VSASRQVGVVGWVVPGIAPDDWPTIAQLARSIVGVLPAFGVHPHWAEYWNSKAAKALCQFAAAGIAIGEIGLDYSAKAPARQLQQEVFRAQLRIARELGQPVLIHCRHAFADLLAIARAEGVAEVGGIMHAFSGSLEVARECVQQGLLIGVAGPVTYDNAARLPHIVASLGLQHLVLETDSPDLSPEPLRGTSNTPANLPFIARKVAELCGTTVEEVATVTGENTKRVLQVPDFPGR